MTKSAGGDAVQDASRDFPIVVASTPATVKERRAALVVVALLAIAAALIAPFASIQPGRVDAFIPVIQTIMCFADLVTAALLLSQYSVEPRPAGAYAPGKASVCRKANIPLAI